MSLIPNVQNSAAQPPSITSLQTSATPPQPDYTTRPALTPPFFQNQFNPIVTLIAEENDLDQVYRQEYNPLHFKLNCGKATVRLKSTDAPCEVSITKEILSDNQYRFYAHPIDCAPKIGDIIGNRIGEIKFSILQKKDVSGFPDKERSARRLDMTPIVYIDTIFKRTAKYKGIGSMLLQAALEEGYAQGCEDAALEACYSSHAFHYLQGFRSPRERINARIDKIVKQNRSTGTLKDTSNLYGVPMYLAPQGKEYWKKQIREHPILETTKEEQVMRLLRS